MDKLKPFEVDLLMGEPHEPPPFAHVRLTPAERAVLTRTGRKMRRHYYLKAIVVWEIYKRENLPLLGHAPKRHRFHDDWGGAMAAGWDGDVIPLVTFLKMLDRDQERKASRRTLYEITNNFLWIANHMAERVWGASHD